MGTRKIPVVAAEPQTENLEELKSKISELDDKLAALCDEIAQSRTGAFSAHRIACAVAKAHGLTFREMISQRRSNYLVRARQHAMWEIKRNTTLSLPHIGRILGLRDHTTIMHGIKRHQARIDAGEVSA